jgi:hypothetical protein
VGRGLFGGMRTEPVQRHASAHRHHMMRAFKPNPTGLGTVRRESPSTATMGEAARELRTASLADPGQRPQLELDVPAAGARGPYSTSNLKAGRRG